MWMKDVEVLDELQIIIDTSGSDASTWLWEQCLWE